MLNLSVKQFVLLNLLLITDIGKQQIKDLIDITDVEILQLINIDFMSYNSEEYLATPLGNEWVMAILQQSNITHLNVLPESAHEQAILRRKY